MASGSSGDDDYDLRLPQLSGIGRGSSIRPGLNQRRNLGNTSYTFGSCGRGYDGGDQPPVVFVREEPGLSIPAFNGSSTKNKYASFDVWKHMVNQAYDRHIQKGYEVEEFENKIFKSLEGNAREHYVHLLSKNLTLTQRMQQMNRQYGERRNQTELLDSLLSLKQGKNSVAEYALELEKLLILVQSQLGGAHPYNSEESQKDLLRRGLDNTQLKDSIRYMVRDPRYTYDDMKDECIRIEREKNASKRPANVKSVIEDGEKDNLLAKISELEKKLQKSKIVESEDSTQQRRGSSNSRDASRNSQRKRVCYHCGSDKHLRNRCWRYLQEQEKSGNDSTGRDEGRPQPAPRNTVPRH